MGKLAVRRQGRRQLRLPVLDSHAVFDQEILVIGLAAKREILTAGIGIEDIRPIGRYKEFPDFGSRHTRGVQTTNQSTQACSNHCVDLHVLTFELLEDSKIGNCVGSPATEYDDDTRSICFILLLSGR